MDECLLSNKQLLRHEEDDMAIGSTENKESIPTDEHNPNIRHSRNQPLHTINHLVRLNHILAESLLSNDAKDERLSDFQQELKTLKSREEQEDGNLFKKVDIFSEYFRDGPLSADGENRKPFVPKSISSKNPNTNEENTGEMRHTLLQNKTQANFSNDKFCVISQSFWPESHFSKGYCVNYNNLEMLKMSIPDIEDVEEYLEEFYDLHGFDKSLENVVTELFICDAVFMCIFNRHEYYFAKYREYIKHYGTIDILQLREKKESTLLSKKQFVNNCVWVFSMTILCLVFMALFCMSIWITEGLNELSELQEGSLQSNITNVVNSTDRSNSTVEYSLETLPKWNYVSAFYFSAVTMLTIGYGDYSPITVAGQILVIIHAIFGIIWISLLISIIGKRLLQNITFVLHVLSKTIERILRLIISRTKLRYFLTNSIRKCFTNPFAQLVYFVIFLFIYCVVGASIFLSLENTANDKWTFLGSLYFTIISLTTIGFGDVYVKRK